jgi:HD superfamily phosphodiesterase
MNAGLASDPLPESALIAAAVANVEHCGMRPWGLHGLAHWWRVRHNGLLVADAIGANPRVIALFAIFHDSHREDDGYDREHGPRAAAWLARVRDGDRTAHGACETTFAAIRALDDAAFRKLRGPGIGMVFQ